MSEKNRLNEGLIKGGKNPPLPSNAQRPDPPKGSNPNLNNENNEKSN